MDVKEKIENFVDDAIKTQDYELLDILWSFSLSISLLKGKLYTESTKKKIQEWIGIVTKRNLRKKYGSKAKIRKIESLMDFLGTIPHFLPPGSSSEFDEDKKLFEDILINKSSEILISKIDRNLREISELDERIMSFVFNSNLVNWRHSNESKHFILKNWCLEKLTHLFNQYFDEELKELKVMIHEPVDDSFIQSRQKQYREYSFWQIGDEMVKLGIGYWGFEVSSSRKSVIYITPVFIIPYFIYDACNTLRDEFIKIDESKIRKIRDRHENPWKYVASTDAVIYEDVPESEIHNSIASNPEIVEDELELIGSKYLTSVGEIDILCRDKNGNYVVIELKKGRGSHEVIGQIQKYISWVSENLAENNFVRGIVIVKEYDQHLEYA